MLSSRRLVEMARKWKRMAALGRKKISWSTINTNSEADISSTIIADKDHFIVYTSDGKRFMVPLALLRSTIIVELLRMSEEEFGLPSDGPITLLCDADFLKFIISMLRRTISEDLQSQLLMCVTRCSTSSFQDVVRHCQQLAVY